MLFRSLARLGADLARAALIGDTAFDADAARDTGVAFIGVAWGVGAHTDLDAAGAHAIAHAPDDLIAIVRGLAG